jgi:hypothetical protein
MGHCEHPNRMRKQMRSDGAYCRACSSGAIAEWLLNSRRDGGICRFPGLGRWAGAVFKADRWGVALAAPGAAGST